MLDIPSQYMHYCLALSCAKFIVLLCKAVGIIFTFFVTQAETSGENTRPSFHRGHASFFFYEVSFQDVKNLLMWLSFQLYLLNNTKFELPLTNNLSR